MSEPEKLTEDDNKEMRDFALLCAMGKYQICSTLRANLYASIEQINNYSKAWNSYAKDPTLEKLTEDLNALLHEIPHGYHSEAMCEAVGGAQEGDFDYGHPEDERVQRYQDAGIAYDSKSNYEPLELPFIEPLDMYKRKRAECGG